jgi:DNA-binding NarL/FixJ family response regulator
MIAEGVKTREIASRLCLSVSTIETHRRHIMRKLYVTSVAELTKYAVREGITSIDNAGGQHNQPGMQDF